MEIASIIEILGIAIIALVLYKQMATSSMIKAKIIEFKSIFPNSNAYDIVKNDDEVDTIECRYTNKIMNNIVGMINDYMVNNKSTAIDFNLIKDIVDRTCDTKEDEINVQVPFTLYYGLMGTMTGIVFGVVSLIASGSLNGSNSDFGGIKTLLIGIAIAMLASGVGIFLTTMNSNRLKDAKVIVAQGKDSFLSWMQENLLPNMSGDLAGQIGKMVRQLDKFNSDFAKNNNLQTESFNSFNSSFSTNSDRFNEILSSVKKTTEDQQDLLKEIDKVKPQRLTEANIRMFDKLDICMGKIESFAKYLSEMEKYLESMRLLNNKLDEYEERTQVIEAAGNFYKNNEELISGNMDTVTRAVRESLDRFGEMIEESMGEIVKTIENQQLLFGSYQAKQKDSFKAAIDGQMELMEQNLQQASELIESKMKQLAIVSDEIKSWTTIVKILDEWRQELNSRLENQSSKLNELKSAINNLEKTVIQKKIEVGEIKVKSSMPSWVFILFGITSGVIITASIVSLLVNFGIKLS